MRIIGQGAVVPAAQGKAAAFRKPGRAARPAAGRAEGGPMSAGRPSSLLALLPASLPRLLLAAALLAGISAIPSAPAAEGPAAPPAPGKPGEDAGSLAALRKEMEDTYLEIQKDFEALTASRSAETIAGLDAAIADEAKGRPGVPIDPSQFAEVWTKRGLLGPVTAKRLGARMPEAIAKATEEKGGAAPTTADALRHAVKLVFPEPTMADNWDKHFTDLDVVQRWAKAKGASPPASDPGKAPSSPDPSDMVLVPKGELAVPDQRGRGWPQLGVKAEKRTVKAFYIDRTEVTGAAYAKFLRETKDARLRDRVLPKLWKLDDKGAPVMPDGAAILPVAGVPYEGAAAFASSLGKRLPWEDEWERAARGNGGFKFPWGNDWVDGNAVAGGKPGPAAAGATAGDRSPFGLLDMAGNVSELCATYPDGKPVKGLPRDTDQVIIRGGNFKNPPDEASNDWRYVTGANTRNEWIGFRCAMDEKDFERRYGKK